MIKQEIIDVSLESICVDWALRSMSIRSQSARDGVDLNAILVNELFFLEIQSTMKMCFPCFVEKIIIEEVSPGFLNSSGWPQQHDRQGIPRRSERLRDSVSGERRRRGARGLRLAAQAAVRDSAQKLGVEHRRRERPGDVEGGVGNVYACRASLP